MAILAPASSTALTEKKTKRKKKRKERKIGQLS